MKVERDYLGKRYTFIPTSKEDERFIEVFNKYVDELKEENKKLKESLDIATKCSSMEEDGIIRLSEENRKLKLHIEAKDKAYTALLKDYEELKEDNKRLRAEIEEWLNTIRQKI